MSCIRDHRQTPNEQTLMYALHTVGSLYYGLPILTFATYADAYRYIRNHLTFSEVIDIERVF